MRIVVVGSVAAGTSLAAKARRKSEAVDIALYERDSDVSYSGCGLPHYLGGEVDDLERLRPRDAEWFARRYHVDIRTRHEVLRADPATRTLGVRNLDGGATCTRARIGPAAVRPPPQTRRSVR